MTAQLNHVTCLGVSGRRRWLENSEETRSDQLLCQLSLHLVLLVSRLALMQPRKENTDVSVTSPRRAGERSLDMKI